MTMPVIDRDPEFVREDELHASGEPETVDLVTQQHRETLWTRMLERAIADNGCYQMVSTFASADLPSRLMTGRPRCTAGRRDNAVGHVCGMAFLHAMNHSSTL